MLKQLVELGLSEKEAEMYLLTIKTGETTANRLADLGGLARSTTYDILEKLRHQGFITTFVRDKKTYFLANNPEILLTTIEEKEKALHEEFKHKRESLKKLIPQLKDTQNQINNKPVAEIFEGKVSVSKVLDEIAQTTGDVKIIGNQDNAITRIGYRTDKFRLKRKEHGIKVHQILEDSAEARKEKSDAYTAVKFLKSIKDSKDAIFMYGDTTVHLILAQEVSAIRIQSKEYTKAQEINFDELWKVAKS